MPRFPLPLLLTALLLGACHKAPITAAPVRPGNVAAQSVPGRLLVHWKRPEAAAGLLRKLGAQVIESLGAERVGATAMAAPSVIDLPPGVDADAFRLAAGDALDWAEPDRIMHLVGTVADDEAVPGETDEATRGRADGSNGDPRRGAQWALTKVRVEEAWRVTRGKPDVRIAIVDTGCDLEHPDLRSQIADSYRANGLLGRLGFASAKDDCGHGTHCAGIAAAAAGNGEGIAGVAPGCKLLVAKALDQNGAGATSDIVRGIRWSVSHGARVLSLSMGGEENSHAMADAIQDALRAGVVVVAAMGNEGKQLKNFPAAYPGVIAVGATGKADQATGFSTRGAWISVAAPGASILSTAPTYGCTMNSGPDAELKPGYGTLSGTSMATPLVAGLAALVLSAHPDWSPAQVKAAIERGSTAVGGGFNPRTGHGRVDAAKTLGARREE